MTDRGRLSFFFSGALNMSRVKKVIGFYYMAYRSMMEMEHSDWFLSRSLFSSPDRQMDRSDGPLTRHALFCFGL